MPVEIVNWWTVRHTATYLKISLMSTYRAIAAGRMRAVETPLGMLIDPASVEDYARTRRPVYVRGQKASAYHATSCA